ncbi:MAG: hypothetical protein JWQ38_49, partial [Flavipsychrobacter sp.]|nr:hypothetical protein [Flavipsychrobacter sp.]
DVLFHHGEEAQVGAYDILCEQKFLFDNDDLLAVKAEWESIKADPEKRPKNEKIFKWTEDAVGRFIAYLD